MTILGYVTGTLSIIVAGALSYWQWWIIGEGYGMGRKEVFISWERAVILALLQVVFTAIGTKILFGFSMIVFFWLYLAVVFLPGFVYDFRYFITTKPVLVSKPPDGGRVKTFVYITIQFALMVMLLWLIWISVQVVYKVRVGSDLTNGLI